MVKDVANGTAKETEGVLEEAVVSVLHAEEETEETEGVALS